MAVRRAVSAVFVFSIGLVHCGCARHQERPLITAVGLSPANRCDPPGIPYYLPKPLLVVAKNTRHIDESKVGLTGPVPIPGGFDNQAAYGDIKANVTVPGTTATPVSGGDTTFTQNLDGTVTPSTHSMVTAAMTPSGRVEDGIEPDSFFTYQVIFIPDLTQKYGLQITGGAGEFRAAMNMVNGWMYTGMGPFYLKDSSSAQNAMATGVGAMYAGRGAADVLNEVGELATAVGTIPKKQESGGFQSTNEMAETFRAIAQAAEITPRVPETMLNYAEVYIYEPVLTTDGASTEWRLVAEHHFDRQFFSAGDPEKTAAAKAQIVTSMIGALQKHQDASATPDAIRESVQSEVEKAFKTLRAGKPEGADFGGQANRELLLGEPENGEPSSRAQPRLRLPEPQIPAPFPTPPAEDAAAPTNSINIEIDGDESAGNLHHLQGLRELLTKPRPTIKTRSLNQAQRELKMP